MIQIQQNEMLKFEFATKEEHDNLKVNHRCVDGKMIMLPKYLYIPPSYPSDYTIDGYERIKDNTAELKYCPFCKMGVPI